MRVYTALRGATPKFLGETTLEFEVYPGKIDYWMPVFERGKLVTVVKFKWLHTVGGMDNKDNQYYMVIVNAEDVKYLPNWKSISVNSNAKTSFEKEDNTQRNQRSIITLKSKRTVGVGAFS